MNNCNKISPTNNQERRSIVKSIVKRVVDIVAHCVAELLGIKRSEEKLEYATNITHRDQNRGFFKAEIQEA
jgi:hypothetical protein